MLQLTIILLLFSVTQQKPHGSPAAKTPISNQSHQNVLLSQNGFNADDKLKNPGEPGVNDNQAKKAEFKTYGTPWRAEVNIPNQSLEECFGGLGRLLSCNNSKKKNLAKKRNCSCLCCPKRSKSLSSVTSGKDGSRSKKCCVYARVSDCEGSTDKSFGEKTGRMVGDTPGDSKASSIKFNLHNPIDAEHLSLLDSPVNAVVATMQYNRGKEISWDTRSRSFATRGDADCCCEKCCKACHDSCLLPSFLYGIGWLPWAVDRGCRLCCERFGDCLEIFRCCR